MSECEESPITQQEEQEHPDHTRPESQATTATMRSAEQPSSSTATSPDVIISPQLRPKATQRQPSSGLNLVAMPKYHPAIYKSPAQSTSTTPGSSRPTSRGLLSPRNHARHFSEVQRQQQEYQRQMLATLQKSTGLTGAPPSHRPSAPHLLPLDSPGPATPLNLEESGDYLSARSIGEGSPRQLADRMIREEQERRAGMRAGDVSPAISPRC